MVGSSYKPLPEKLRNIRDGIVNVNNSENDDRQCFKWAITRYLHPVKRKDRAETLTEILRRQSEELNWDGIHFPTAMSEMDVFENINKISVMVFRWDDDVRRAIYLRLPKTKYKKTVQIFYYDNHYSTVKSVSALMRSIFNDNASHYCPYCTFNHRTEDAIKLHIENFKMDKITVEKMPKEGCS